MNADKLIRFAKVQGDLKTQKAIAFHDKSVIRRPVLRLLPKKEPKLPQFTTP
jgi:hypothetical protein